MLLIVIDLLAMMVEFQETHINFFRLMGQIIWLVFLTGIFTFSLFSIVFKYKYILKEVFSTDRNLKISAFEGIITERADQETAAELSNISNDPMTQSL